MLTVRRAVYEDIPNIMRFFDQHWKPGNILAVNREFFEWQFVEDGKVNLFLGIDDEEGKIYGTFGWIEFSHYEYSDIAGCTWKTIKSSNPMLGLDLQTATWEQITSPRPRYGVTTCLSKKAARIVQLQGMAITTMDHYYRLVERGEYRIALVKDMNIPQVPDSGYQLERIDSVEEMMRVLPEEELLKVVPVKDYRYIKKRYFDHPVYQYDIWKIVRPDTTSRAVLVTREATHDGAVMCKIINYYGEIEDISKITYALDKLAEERGYEYYDVYSHGVPTQYYDEAGFLPCGEDCVNIVPNYFHPFAQINVTLTITDLKIPGLRLFRSDGDQDRPG